MVHEQAFSEKIDPTDTQQCSIESRLRDFRKPVYLKTRLSTELPYHSTQYPTNGPHRLRDIG